MQQAAGGDTDAFAQVYRRYGSDVLAFLSRYRFGRQAGEDFAQEVFLRAWRGAGAFRGAAAVKTYLLGIARNVAREAWTAASRRPPAPPSLLVTGDCPCGCRDCHSRSQAEALQCRAQLLGRLAREVDALPDKLREAFELTIVGQMRVPQAAEKLGCTTSALRMRLRRAVALLAESLEPQDAAAR
jgi:RNA polymerase sigma-70 factor (ECF subfamily)